MLEMIRNCDKCNMCKNQRPLLDRFIECDVMWVGLSAKQVEDITQEVPLDQNTLSGKLINEIEKKAKKCIYYKTNIVKCLPLNDRGKLRYPTMKEIDLCMPNLLLEIEYLKPKVIILLGKRVIKAIEKNLNLTFDEFDGYDYKNYCKDSYKIVPIHHPSYISVYKRKSKELYIESVRNIIQHGI